MITVEVRFGSMLEYRAAIHENKFDSSYNSLPKDMNSDKKSGALVGDRYCLAVPRTTATESCKHNDFSISNEINFPTHESRVSTTQA